MISDLGWGLAVLERGGCAALSRESWRRELYKPLDLGTLSPKALSPYKPKP